MAKPKRITADDLRAALVSTSTPGAAAKELGIKVTDLAAMLEIEATRDEFKAASAVAKTQSRARVIDALPGNIDKLSEFADCDDPRKSVAFAAVKELITLAEKFIEQDLGKDHGESLDWDIPDFPVTRVRIEDT